MADHEEPHLEQAEPEVLTGDDEFPRQPAPPLDPYTPTPHPPRGENEARAWSSIQWALIPIAVVVAILLYVAIR
jgi:hypothetical protein